MGGVLHEHFVPKTAIFTNTLFDTPVVLTFSLYIIVGVAPAVDKRTIEISGVLGWFCFYYGGK